MLTDILLGAILIGVSLYVVLTVAVETINDQLEREALDATGHRQTSTVLQPSGRRGSRTRRSGRSSDVRTRRACGRARS